MNDETIPGPAKLAAVLARRLQDDLVGEGRKEPTHIGERPGLDRIDDYEMGRHDRPYTPPDADQEFARLAAKSVTNLIPRAITAVTQKLRVLGYRRLDATVPMDELPEWRLFKRNGMDSRQRQVHHAAIKYGLAFVTVDMDGAWTSLSPRRTSVEYADASAGIVAAAFTVITMPNPLKPGGGRGVLWDGPTRYAVTFKSLLDAKSFEVGEPIDTGFDECPVAAFAPFRDIEGSTPGIVAGLIPAQNRLNQTTFDLLTGQTNSTFAVRTVAGLVPDTVRERVPVDPDDESLGYEWVDVLDDNGRPQLKEVKVSARTIMYSESPDTKFGSLPPAPLDGLIASVEQAINVFASMASIPAYYFNSIDGVSARALNAADATLVALAESAQAALSESWERVFRWARVSVGESDNDWFMAEVGWADPRNRSEAELADAASKWVAAGAPKRGVWRMFSGMNPALEQEWLELSEQELPDDPSGSFGRAARE